MQKLPPTELTGTVPATQAPEAAAEHAALARLLTELRLDAKRLGRSDVLTQLDHLHAASAASTSATPLLNKAQALRDVLHLHRQRQGDQVERSGTGQRAEATSGPSTAASEGGRAWEVRYDAAAGTGAVTRAATAGAPAQVWPLGKVSPEDVRHLAAYVDSMPADHFQARLHQITREVERGSHQSSVTRNLVRAFGAAGVHALAEDGVEALTENALSGVARGLGSAVALGMFGWHLYTTYRAFADPKATGSEKRDELTHLAFDAAAAVIPFGGLLFAGKALYHLVSHYLDTHSAHAHRGHKLLAAAERFATQQGTG